jgi:hypothetical protein
MVARAWSSACRRAVSETPSLVFAWMSFHMRCSRPFASPSACTCPPLASPFATRSSNSCA